MNNFELIMISAMYENGGNTLQRYLDGHPALYVYPFESQLGTKFCIDNLSSLFPYKYRWPEFPLNGTVEEDFELFFDEELKTRIRFPLSSKFKDANIEMDEKERKSVFIELMKSKKRERASLIEAFFQSTFKSWKNFNYTGKERVYVGYSPIVGIDAPKIFNDFPNAKVIHVVRNPYSAYADTKKRPFPLSLDRYAQIWNIVQYYALIYKRKFPKNFYIIRYEDLCENVEKFMKKVCDIIRVDYYEELTKPCWNRKRLNTIYPWGTIRIADVESNKKSLNELSVAERKEIRSICYQGFLEEFGYETYDKFI
ncbi:MAG: sulfotransferase [Candidatus Micrarchaeota archaeon]|nr:sulfotransferase [Candidatus Micrarchaeota archaeon]